MAPRTPYICEPVSDGSNGFTLLSEWPDSDVMADGAEDEMAAATQRAADVAAGRILALMACIVGFVWWWLS